MLTGFVDYCRGRYIVGWAVPDVRDGHCRITVADSTGRIIAGAIASEPRRDLSVVAGGRTDFAFRVGVPLTDAPGPVRVLADGVELANSPVFLDEDHFDAELAIEQGIVTGWVANRRLLPIAQPIEIFDQDGKLVLTLAAEQDPADSDPLFRPGRFTALLPDSCFGRAELCLTAKLGKAVVARAFGYCRLEGYLDTVTDSDCDGWLFSPDAPERTFEVAVYRAGVLAGSGRTALYRDDVSRRYPGADDCGFSFALTPDRDPPTGLTHTSIRLLNATHELFGGPFLVGSRARAALDAYGAISAVTAGDSGAAILRDGFARWMASLRDESPDIRLPTRALPASPSSNRRLTIVIPVFGDVAATRACLDSVMRTRCPDTDAVVIVNDNPGDRTIAEVVDAHGHDPDVFVLRNDRNLGFIGSVNRAIGFLRLGDVLLLNADAELFPGAIDEMHRVLHGASDVGTVTAMSSNATLFTYPHPEIVRDTLDDIAWPDLAAVALRENAGKSVAIPTAHGFCMLIRRAVIAEIGSMDEAFGRGFGEENDYSIRSADRGWRHVLAGGALVRHDEAASFGSEKPALLAANLALLSDRYPEYEERIRHFARTDPVRTLRWPLDLHRLRRFHDSGGKLELVVANALEGGAVKAAADIAVITRTPDIHALRLTATMDGRMTLALDGLRLRSVFQLDEAPALFAMLAELKLERVVVHQLLGFSQGFVRALKTFITDRPSIFHVHDYYYACPRVTLIDASGAFCDGAPPDRCVRCIALDGAHTAHRMEELSPADHRKLFQDVLTVATRVIAPSSDTAERLARLIPGSRPVAVPHPQGDATFPIGLRRGSLTDICLLGAIGPHKGSDTLLALARHARLHDPTLRFHVVGYTNIDDALRAVGNVTISGEYEPDDLPAMVEATGARIALFLHGWPETFSYTLTEAASLGLIPVVPDIGAPAQRIRAAGLGVVFPFPIDVANVVEVLQGITDGTVPFAGNGARPLGFDTSESHDRLRSLYREGLSKTATPVASSRRRGTVTR